MAGFSIAELKNKRAQLKARMAEMVSKETDESPMTEEDVSTFEDLKKQVETIDARVSRIEDAMGDAVEAAKASDEDEADESEKSFHRSNLVIKDGSHNPYARKGASAANWILANYIAKNEGAQSAARYAADSLHDRNVAKMFSNNGGVTKTPVALGTAAQSVGGAFIPQDFLPELVELLYSKTVVRKSGATVYPMPMGNLTIPRLASSATAAWVGENVQIAASNPTTDDIQLSAKTLASIVSVSKNLILRSPLAVQTIITDNMIRDLALKEDLAFLTGAGSGGVPSGITTLMASGNVLTMTALGTAGTQAYLQNILTNLNGLIQALTVQNVDTDGAAFYMHPSVTAFLRNITDATGAPVFAGMLNPRNGLNLLGYNVFETTQLPTNLTGTTNGSQIFFVQPRHLIVADTLEMQADVSDVASYALNGTATSTFGAFQTAIRLVKQVDFNMQHNFAASVMTVTGWSAGGFTPGVGVEYNTQALNTGASAAQSANPTG